MLQLTIMNEHIIMARRKGVIIKLKVNGQRLLKKMKKRSNSGKNIQRF